MKDQLNWGILGVARINQKLVPAFHEVQCSRLVAIASRSLKKADMAAKQYRIPKTHGSYEALLADPEVDAVYLPLPNALHVEWVTKAANAGKHVLCEKPLGLTAKEVESAVAACNANGVLLMDGFMWPHHPRTHAIDLLIKKKDTLGEIRHIHSSFTFLLPEAQNEIRRSKAMGGGALFDVGCYCIQAALWAFGRLPKSVFARATFAVEIDTQMSVILDFGAGKTATCDFGFELPYRSDVEIITKNAILRIPNLWNPPEESSYELCRRGDRETVHFPAANQVHCMVENFSRACLSGEHLIPSVRESLKLLTVIDAIFESARTNLPIELPEKV